MSPISTPLTSSMTALRLLSESHARSATTMGVTSAGSAKTLAGDLSGPSSDATVSGDVSVLLDYAAAAKLAAENADIASAMRQTGADAISIRQHETLSAVDYQAKVMSFLREQHGSDAAFQVALKNGTISIRRPEEVTELSLPRMVEYAVYKDGYLQGGGATSLGREKFDQAKYQAISDSGISQVVGSINGQEFYATWSDPALAK